MVLWQGQIWSHRGFFLLKLKVKILDFSGNFVACGLNVARYTQHNEIMKMCEYSRPRSFLDIGQSSFTY